MQMRKSMKKIARLLSGTFALLLLSVAALAQNVITGKVTDSKDGSPASRVTVTVKGTKIATKTADDGSYSISAPSKDVTLVFTSTEFGRQEIATTGGTANASLTKAVQNLGEVVVIGYGSVKKKDLTGSVTNVTSKDFNKGQNSTAESLISGKVAGVAVTSNGGAPGSGSTIRIRGGASLNASNDPLIVVDGVPLANGGGGVSGSPSALSLINPNDIESFSVLKDASATAIYGSRASNGVILITTKKGKRGKPVFNFSSQLGVAQLVKKVDVLTADQVRTYVTANGKTSDVSLLGTASTDWQDLIFQTAMSTDNNFSVAGSAGKMPYRISLGYLNQDGILKTGNLERISGSFSLSPKFFTNHLSVDINFKGSTSHSSFANEGAIGSAVYFDPTQSVYSGTQKYGGYWQWLDPAASPKGLRDLAGRNPVGLLRQQSNIGTSRRSIGNIQVDYKFHFLPELHANVNVGYDVSHGFGGSFVSDSAATSYKRFKAADGTFHGGSLSPYAGRNFNTVSEAYLAYGKDYGNKGTRLDLMAGTSYQDFLNYNYSYPDKTLDGTLVSTPTYEVDRPRARLLSYFSRLTYNYAGKYILTASVRKDGSSKFNKNNRWGTFPSAALAWRMKNESFLKNSKTFSELKLRVGYGITGQQDGIGYYDTKPFYTIGNGQAQYQLGYNTDGTPHFDTIYRPSGFYEGRKWEQTATSNIGIDFGFLNNRITGSVDYYFKKTKDLLNTIDVTAGGFSNKVTANVGTLENKGLELTLNTVPVRNSKITWDLGFNVTYNENKITKLTISDNPNFVGNQFGSTGGFNTIQINSVDYSRAAFYAFQQVYDAAGKPIEGLYVDRNRDGVINEKDLYHYKAPDANVFVGLSTGVTIGKINAGFVMRGSFGNYMYNGVQSGGGIKNTVINPLGYLQNGNPSLLETNFTGAGDKFNRSDYFIQNASFVKMDNAYFGYNVGKVFKSNANLRLNAAIQNVFTITKYKGLDPEIGGGIDLNIYPRPRTYTLGLNLDF